MKALAVPDCPFVNLPKMRPGLWGEGVTANKTKECRWLASSLVARFEFLE